MSIRTSVYTLLANDPILNDLLPSKPADLGDGPSIYEYPVHPDAPYPYIVLTFGTSRGDHPVKRIGRVGIDVMNEGGSTLDQETIFKRIIELLDLRRFYDPDDGPITLYLENEGEFITDSEAFLHWNMTFTYNSWRKSFIESLNNRI